jgi:uncharacterized protein DUF6029
MHLLIRLSLVAGLLAMTQPAYAFDFKFPWTDKQASFEITETMVFDFHDANFDKNDTNDDYFDLRNQLNLKLAIDDFTFSARIDTATFFEESALADPAYLDRYGPEKLTAEYRGKQVKISLGDFYTSFGRGLALRIRKTDQLGEDTTLLGGKIRAELGPVELTGLAGLSNVSNTDAVTEKTFKDPYDVVSGLQASWRIADLLTWSIHGVGVFYDPLERNNEVQGKIATSVLPQRAFVAGTSLEVVDLYETADLYLEFNWLQKNLIQSDLPNNDGWALYFGGNVYLDNWTIVAEAKSYSDYQLATYTDSGNYLSGRLDYIRPPTLEPEDMEINNNYSVSGGRLKVDWRPADKDTLLFVSYAGFLAIDPYSAGNRWIYNASLGAEQDFLERGLATVSVGLREEVPLWTGGDHHHLIYLNASVKMPLGKRHSLDLHGNNWWAHDHLASTISSVPPQLANYLIGEWSLGYSWSPWGSLSLIVGYDTKFSGKQDLDVFIDLPDGTPIRQVFFAGSLTLNLTDMFVIKVLAGQLHGGPKCINGACRIFPPFSGARLEMTFRI